MRIAHWIPVALLALVLAGIGFRYGLIRQGITETDVITLYAQKYLADHAAAGQAGRALTSRAKASDCAARPGAGLWTWLVVICHPAGAEVGQGFRYEINWLGGLIRASRPGHHRPSEPET